MFGRPPRRAMRAGDEAWLTVRAMVAAAALLVVVVYWAFVLVD